LQRANPLPYPVSPVQKVEPREFLDRIKTIALFFDSLNEKELQVLKHWIENSVEDRLAKEAVKRM